MDFNFLKILFCKHCAIFYFIFDEINVISYAYLKTTIMKTEILNLIYQAVDLLNEQFDGEKIVEKKPSTILFGKSAAIDSIELVNFIVLLEEKMEEVFNIQIILADERAFQTQNSPFETIQSLTKYLESICVENKIKF